MDATTIQRIKSARIQALESISTAYSHAIHNDGLIGMMESEPALYAASSISFFSICSHCDPINKLIWELDSWRYDPNFRRFMPDACSYLIRIFSKTNELECTMAVLRWMHENGFETDEPEQFRL